MSYMSTQHKSKSQTSEYRRAYYQKNKEHIRAKARALRTPERLAKEAAENKARYHAMTPAQRKERTLKTLYGITLAEWDAMLSTQDFKCAICGDNAGKSREDWATDHCHTTGKVRSILCPPCNLGLGHFKDDTARLNAAISYLNSHTKVPNG
jgi:hypothetical protein